MKSVVFDFNDAVKVCENMINNMENIHKDDKGYYFYGGTKNNDIECPINREILEDNESRLKKTFKYHHNWSNMRHSQKPVGNHLRFIFCKLTNTKTYKGHTIRFGEYTCKKYYVPECLNIRQDI
tara:strand:+ start:617 stop:988 length:372 start_codon:yes stop_codon:yes gene_type:complete